ncbi:MAG TPA: alpha/beta fold hydrolase [Ktedonobacteraceae bacterium]
MSLPIIPGAEPVSVSGTRGGILLLHGYGSTPQQLRSWGLALAQAGFSVEVPLLPGHGTTAEDLDTTGWSDYLKCAETYFKKLRARHQHVFVGGICLGGMLAAWMEIQHPKRIAGLLLMNVPFKSPKGGSMKIGRRLIKLGKRFFHLPANAVFVADPDAPAVISYNKLPIEPMGTILPYFELIRKRAPKIQCPSLVFTSKLDPTASAKEAEYWNENSGPVEQILLERSNHAATLDYDKDLVNELTIAFANDIIEGSYTRGQDKESSWCAHKKSAAVSTAAIDVQSLAKRYHKTDKADAVDQISFQVRTGEIFGLLGPNGAGKSTTIGVLTTTVRSTGGIVSIMGINVSKDPLAVKQRISVVPQKCNLDQSLTAREILTYHASYHGIPRAEREARATALLEEFGLTTNGNSKVKTFSGGMAQRLLIARALMHNPDVLFLDEPTNNLDPQARLFLWERIRALKERGMTIMLTTHDMEEASRLCDRIAIMDKGHILVCDTPDELVKLIPGGSTLEVRVRVPAPMPVLVSVGAGTDADSNIASASDEIQHALQGLPGAQRVEEIPLPKGEAGQTDTAVFRIYGESVSTLIPKTIHMVAETNAELCDLHINHPSLEDVFIHLTGRNLRA